MNSNEWVPSHVQVTGKRCCWNHAHTFISCVTYRAPPKSYLREQIASMFEPASYNAWPLCMADASTIGKVS